MNHQRKANESLFLFCSSRCPAETFMVQDFSGCETVSGMYRFDIFLVAARSDLDIAGMINTRATLYLLRSATWIPVSGIITRAEYISHSADYSRYHVVLEPVLHRTTLTTQCRIFQKMTVPGIVSQVLDENGIGDRTDHCLSGTYPERDYVAQYNETDFNFISRLMEQNGMWYFFTEDPVTDASPSAPAPGETLVITDDPSSFAELPADAAIVYRAISSMNQVTGDENRESIHALQEHQRAISAEVIVKRYCYGTPEMDISAVKNVPEGDTGTVYRYGGGFATATEAEQAAHIIANRHASQKRSVSGRSSCSALRPGAIFSVEDHPRSSLNTSYVVTSVRHTGKMLHGDSGGAAYTNSFEGFSTDRAAAYCPPITAHPPSVPDIMTARIEGTGPDYATLDDLGRYKIRMPFDLSSTENYQASPAIRLAQLYSGSDYGVHFPVHEGAEMVIAHVNGDPDLPLGLKVVPDANTISPVTDRNHTASIIRTAAKNEILMDDSEDREHLRVYTPGSMYLQAGHDGSESADGNRTVTVGGDEKKSVTENETATVKGNRTTDIAGSRNATVSGNFKIDVTKKSTITTDGNATVEVGGDLGEKCSLTRTLEVSGDNAETIAGIHATDIGTVSTIDATGDLSITAGGNFGALAKAAVLITGTNITIKADNDLAALSGQASVALAQDGIALSGATVTMTAGMVDSSAKTNNNITGLAVVLN